LNKEGSYRDHREKEHVGEDEGCLSLSETPKNHENGREAGRRTITPQKHDAMSRTASRQTNTVIVLGWVKKFIGRDMSDIREGILIASKPEALGSSCGKCCNKTGGESSRVRKGGRGKKRMSSTGLLTYSLKKVTGVKHGP